MFIVLLSLYFVKGKSYEHSLIIYWTALVLFYSPHFYLYFLFIFNYNNFSKNLLHAHLCFL